MFSAFFKLIETFQAFKVKKIRDIRKQAEKLKKRDSLGKRLNILQTQKEIEKDEGVQAGKSQEKKDKAKLLLLKITTAVVSFIETVFIWLIATIGVVGFFVILAAVVTIIIVMGLLNALDGLDNNNNMTDIPGGLNSGYRTEIQWTEEEIGLYGNYFNNYELNLFKQFVLVNQALNGYGAGVVYNIINGENYNDILLPSIVGIQGQETGFDIYKGDGEKTKDVFVDLTTVGYENAKHPGPWQCGPVTLTEDSTFKDGPVIEALRNKYDSGRIHSVENREHQKFFPYASYTATRMFYGKIRDSYFYLGKVNERKARFETEITGLLTDLGVTDIQEQKEALKYIRVFSAHMLYGFYPEAGFESLLDIAKLQAALFAYSKDENGKHSFDNYSLNIINSDGEISFSYYSKTSIVTDMQGDYTQCALKGGFIDGFTTGATTTKYLELNGKKLNNNLYYLISKEYSGNAEVQKALRTVISFVDGTSTAPAYEVQGARMSFGGLTSHLLGRAIQDYLINKIPVATTQASGNGFLSAKQGEVQGDWNDSDLIGKLNSSPHKGSYGTAFGLVNSDTIMHNGITFEQWRQNSKWKVPYYRQSSSAIEGKPGHGKMRLYYDGCHVYMNAYIASALTGKLINPVEMMVAMSETGSLQSNGYYNNTYTNVDNVFDYLGIHCIRGDMGSSIIRGDDLKEFEKLLGPLNKMNTKEIWQEKVDKLLELNGLVGMSMGPKATTDGLQFTTGTNHYIVITEKIGDKYKTMGYGTGSNGYKRDMVEHTWDDIYSISVNGAYKGQVYFMYNPNIESVLSASTCQHSFVGMSNYDKYKLIFGKPTKPKTASDISQNEISKKIKTIKVNLWTGTASNKISKKVSISVHEALVDNVKAIFNEIYNHPSKPVMNYGGGYNYRTINNGTNTNTLSNHSFGTAFDFNVPENPYLRSNGTAIVGNATKYKPNDDELCFHENHIVVKTFVKYGWRWGGDYGDNMHFEFFGGD